MAIAQRGSSESASDATGTTLTVNKPTGVVSGDYILVMTQTGNVISSGPSGFTELVAVSGGNPRIFLYGKVADGSEGSTFTATMGASGNWSIHCVAFSGVDNTTPWEVSPTGASDYTQTLESFAGPDVAAGASSRWVIGGAGCNNTTGSFTQPTGWTELIDYTAGRTANISYIATGSAQTSPTWSHSATNRNYAVWTGALAAAATAQNINVGLVADAAETAQVVGRSKRVNVGQVTETAATAQAVGKRKQAAAGLTSETDTALAVTPGTPPKNINVGLVTEVDSAKMVLQGLDAAAEVDIALPIAFTRSQAVGPANEAETAFSLAAVKSASLGLAGEADSGHPFSSAKVRTIGAVLEPDAAQSITATKRKSVTIGLAPEFDDPLAPEYGSFNNYALPITVVVTFPGLQTVVETDVAQSLAHKKAVSVGQATEVDTAQAASRRKSVLIGQAVESDSAVSVGKRRAYAVSSALENDSANAISSQVSKYVPLAQASESDTAQAITRLAGVPVGLASETDAAQPLTSAVTHKRAVGMAQETDSAQPMSMAGNKNIPVGTATESDSAQGLVSRKRKATGTAVEVDGTQTIIVRRAYPIGLAQTTDTSTAMARRKRKATGLTTEADSPLPLSFAGQKNIAVGLAIESDSATGLSRKRTYTVQVVVDTDSATGVQIHKTRLVVVALEDDLAQTMGMRVGFVPATHPWADFAPGMGRSGQHKTGSRTATIVSGTSGATDNSGDGSAQVVRNSTTTWRNH